MKIEKEKLVGQLVEKSDLTPEFVEEQLNRLIRKIHETAAKGKALEIKGFGMFYRSKEGNLTFEPTEDFATEINYRYAGMEPLEVASGKPVPVQEAGDQYDLSSIHAGAVKGEKEESSEAIKSSTAKKGADPHLVSKPEKDVTKTKGKASADRKSQDRRAIGKSERDSIMSLVYTVITVAVLAVTLIYVLDLNRTGAKPDPEPFVQETPAPDDTDRFERPSGVDEENGITETRERTGQERSAMEEQVSPAVEEVLADDEENMVMYGLHGDIVELQGRYYAIVLHSMSNKFRAEEAADRLRAEGYREMIHRVESSEHGTMWRVGIGQFDSVESAQEAVEQLPESMQENHFIGRIQ